MKKKLLEILTRRGTIAALCIAFGVLLIIFKDHAAKAICMAAGGVISVVAIIRLIKQAIKEEVQVGLIFNLILLGMGVTLLVFAWFITSLVAVVIGTIIGIKSFLEIREALVARQFGEKRWQVDLVFASVEFLLGVILTMMLFVPLNVVAFAIGVVLSAEGALDVVAMIIDMCMTKADKKHTSDMIVTAEEVDSNK